MKEGITVKHTNCCSKSL